MQYGVEDGMVECSCHNFERVGILCRHCFSAIIKHNVSVAGYIYDVGAKMYTEPTVRWT